MSGNLKIRFGPDLPAMAVDVVAPNYQVVKSLMLSAGEEQSVEVPSEGSFLRLYLPSGPAVVLSDPGSLERTITRQSLQSAWPIEQVRSRGHGDAAELPEQGELTSRSAIREHHLRKASELSPTNISPASPFGVRKLPVSGYGEFRLRDPYGALLPAAAAGTSRDTEWVVDGPPFERPRLLEITTRSGARVAMRVPGDATRLWSRADLISKEEALVYSIRLQTATPVADTILNYLARGNLLAAEAMERWAETSEELLEAKMRDPYAATVGAYLLFRLQDEKRLHSWTKNLADRFDFLPDGCVLWAWQLIKSQPDQEGAIGEYLIKATRRGLPIYTEVTRLLIDGLKLMGEAGRDALHALREQSGSLIWDSPLTMSIATDTSTRPAHSKPIEGFNVRFGASA